MRSDYALYTVAVIFFIITGIICFYQVNYRELWIVTTTVLGLFFIGVGYTQRPKNTKAKTPLPAAPVITIKEEEKTSIEATPISTLELTEIKGIGAKRAEHLKALGIANVGDLAKASAEDLASKLKISPKITRRWVEDAKKLLEKT
ncbi:MAG: helix-hairpin-helix domain-containing protein [Candidatus Bathyarchaeia archaeon]|nr:helix-hairpin-helix domain-containing protein [Candidatus Bathyarchaeota archaeon]